MIYPDLNKELENYKEHYFKSVDEVSCVVLSWENWEDTRLGVASIIQEKALLAKCGVKLKLIVVDNGSKDKSQEWLKEQAGIDKLILNDKNLGISAGRNLGLEHRSGKYVFSMDSDITVVRGSYVAMIKYMEAHPEIANLGADHLTTTNTYGEHTYQITDINHVLNDKATAKNIYGVWGIVDMCALTHYGIFRKEVFDKCKFSTEDVFGLPGWGAEDNDFAQQMRKAGFKIQSFSDIVYYHKRSASLSTFRNAKIDDGVQKRRAYYNKKWGFK